MSVAGNAVCQAVLLDAGKVGLDVVIDSIDGSKLSDVAES